MADTDRRITTHEVICVPRAARHIVDGHHHRDDGPAVEWPSGERYFFHLSEQAEPFAAGD